MNSDIKIFRNTQSLFRCPACHAILQNVGRQLVCQNDQCGKMFPIIEGVPVLINEASSIFAIDDFVSRRDTFFNLRESRLKNVLRRLTPGISLNIGTQHNYAQMAKILLAHSSSPRVLVIGGSILGKGIETLVKNVQIELVECDISFGPRTALICDAHDIPFESESFDGVVVQAVLEHVVDPYRCVEEIHRVLKKEGVVYAETPFMQQVHGRQYDFTRFTYLGHRRVFRKFEEINAGVVSGPGTALAWSYQYFLFSFVKLRGLRRLLMIFSRVTGFFLKYFDYYLINKPGAFDAASGYFFLGKKSPKALPDRELIRLYKGAN